MPMRSPDCAFPRMSAASTRAYMSSACAAAGWGKETIPALKLGREATEEMLLGGQRALPGVLESTGYAFKHPVLEEALRKMLR